jgi:uncharacterized protein YqeY
MGLREQLADDLKDALRHQDEPRKRTIRLVMAAMKKEETELDAQGRRVSLDEQGVLDIITEQVKQRRDSMAAYRAGGRQDLVAEEEAELAILQSYLGQKEMPRDEIEAHARQVIAEVGASGPHDLGKVMRPLMARLEDRADGRLANQIVRELLAG